MSRPSNVKYFAKYDGSGGSATPNYDVNYDDKRFQDVEADKKAALNEVDKTYGEMIGQSDSYYNAQIDASKEWAKKQTELQNEQTDFAIQEIEQQKAQEKKDYLKEQSGAYQDYKKQSDQYGANAEAMAAQGMQGTGFAESSQVAMYNQYQNRVTTAREGFRLAIQNYNNAITEARLQNNAALAEIAYQALQKQLELALQGFQHKNQLVLEQADKKMQVENEYYGRYQDVLAQVNQEIALTEQVRQHNDEMAYKNAALEETKRQFDTLHPTGAGGDVIKPTGGSGSSGHGSNRPATTSSKGTSNIHKTSGEKNISSTKKTSGGDLNAKTAQSILDLGQGPISAKNLASQVASGKVKETKDKDGNTVFKYNGLFKRFG